MNKVIGFIGSGNMGSAIIGGVLNSGLVEANAIITSDLSKPALEKLENTYHIRTTHDNLEVVAEADILFLSVKPNIYPIVIKQIKDAVKENVIVVCIAAGQRIEAIQGLFEREIKLVRTMPNTPALVGEGMTGVSPNKLLSTEEVDEVLAILNSIGKTEVVPESMMDVVTGISGSSPAYVYMFIEAMADAAVAEGMPRQQAYTFAAQAVYGSAKMVLETGRHPGDLKDMVCSPGGTTIAAVCELEKQGFRNAVICGLRTCVEKSRELGK